MRPTFELLKTLPYKDGIDILYFKNRICYYKGKDLHREDGPAIIFNSGEEKWYLSGQLHRSGNLPATINCDKTYMTYWVKGIPHRLNGPAIENLVDPSNNKYIIDGEEYEYKNYIVKSRNLKIKNLK